MLTTKEKRQRLKKNDKDQGRKYAIDQENKEGYKRKRRPRKKKSKIKSCFLGSFSR